MPLKMRHTQASNGRPQKIEIVEVDIFGTEIRVLTNQEVEDPNSRYREELMALLRGKNHP